MLKKLAKEIEDLMRARDLLGRLFIELGPYRDGKISDKTWNDVCEFLGFDDSE